MANWDELKQTFFEETKEGLEAIDAGLTDIRDGSESDDTVNAVFRAIHSAKGGAGVFGFEDLVKFAHVFETVLDAIRQQEDVAAFRKSEQLAVPADFDYAALSGLSNELKAKFIAARPVTIGQASRIEGMTPAALTLVAAHVRRKPRRVTEAA